jgi:para-nitrobenzyl esterase
VLYLLESPLARGLYAKAIAQSAYMIAMPELKKSVYGAPSGEAVGQMLAAACRRPTSPSLRAIDRAGVDRQCRQARLRPLRRGRRAGAAPADGEAFDQGKQAPVPLMAGFNQGEIRSLMMLAPKAPATAAEYERQSASYGDLADGFLKLYPAADYKESIIATYARCALRLDRERLARKQTALGQPAYLYMFDHGYPAADRCRAARLPRQRIALCVRHVRPDPAALAEDPGGGRGEGAVRRDARLLDQLREAACPGRRMPRPGRPMARPPTTCTSPMHAACRGRADAGHVRAQRNGDVPAQGGGKTAWNWNTGLYSPKLAPAKGCE